MVKAQRDYPKLISEFRKSGLSTKEFCSQKNIVLSTFQYHLYKKKNSALTPLPEFVPVKPSQPLSSNKIRIELPGGIELTIPVQ